MRRNGQLPVEDVLTVAEIERTINNSAVANDCRCRTYGGFVQPWIAVSSLENWGEDVMTPDGLPDGDQLRYRRPYRRVDDLYADIFGQPISHPRDCEVDESALEEFLGRAALLEDEALEQYKEPTENSSVTIQCGDAVYAIDQMPLSEYAGEDHHLEDASDDVFDDDGELLLDIHENIQPKFVSCSPEKSCGTPSTRKEERRFKRAYRATAGRRCYSHKIQNRVPFRRVTAAKRRRMVEIVDPVFVHELSRGQKARVIAH